MPTLCAGWNYCCRHADPGYMIPCMLIQGTWRPGLSAVHLFGWRASLAQRWQPGCGTPAAIDHRASDRLDHFAGGWAAALQQRVVAEQVIALVIALLAGLLHSSSDQSPCK
eukprot:1161411-Pelagomonas_calceolata.AAC.10